MFERGEISPLYLTDDNVLRIRPYIDLQSDNIVLAYGDGVVFMVLGVDG